MKFFPNFFQNLFTDPTRFDKYSFDFLLDENSNLKNPEYLQNLIENSPNLEDTEFFEIQEQIDEGVTQFCEEHVLE